MSQFYCNIYRLLQHNKSPIHETVTVTTRVLFWRLPLSSSLSYLSLPSLSSWGFRSKPT